MYLEEPVLSVLLPANKIYENALAPQAKIKKKQLQIYQKMFKMSHTAKENTQATETRIFYISSVLAA